MLVNCHRSLSNFCRNVFPGFGDYDAKENSVLSVALGCLPLTGQFLYSYRLHSLENELRPIKAKAETTFQEVGSSIIRLATESLHDHGTVDGINRFTENSTRVSNGMGRLEDAFKEESSLKSSLKRKYILYSKEHIICNLLTIVTAVVGLALQILPVSATMVCIGGAMLFIGQACHFLNNEDPDCNYLYITRSISACVRKILSLYENYWPSFGDTQTVENSKLRLVLSCLPFIGVPVILATMTKHKNLNAPTSQKLSYLNYISMNLALTGALFIAVFAKNYFMFTASPMIFGSAYIIVAVALKIFQMMELRKLNQQNVDRLL